MHWEHFAILTVFQSVPWGEPNFCHHASCCVPCTALKQELLERGIISQRPIGMAGVLICCWQESRGHMLWVLVHPLLLSQALASENGALTSWSELNVVSTLNFYCTRPYNSWNQFPLRESLCRINISSLSCSSMWGQWAIQLAGKERFSLAGAGTLTPLQGARQGRAAVVVWQVMTFWYPAHALICSYSGGGSQKRSSCFTATVRHTA